MKQVFIFCRPYIKQYRWRIFMLVIIYLLASFSSLLGTYLTGMFIDDLLSIGDHSFLARYIFALVLIAAAELLFTYISEHQYLIIQNKSSYSIVKHMLAHVQRMNYSFVQEQSAAALNQQINHDADTVTEYCIAVLQQIASNIMNLVIPFVLVFWLKPLLSVVLCAINILYYVSYALFYRRLFQTQYDLLEEQKGFFAKLHTQLTAVKFLQSHGIAKLFLNRLDPGFNIVLKKAEKNHKVSYCFTGADIIIRTAATILVFLIGGLAVIRNELSVGSLTIVMTYMTMSLSATQYFFSLGSQTQNCKVSCDRLNELFSSPEQTWGKKQLECIERITCQSIGFASRKEDIFSGLTVEFRKGNMYALVGENGSGKSTLLNLVLGLYLGQYQGKIQYNDIPIEQIDMEAVRRELIGLSEQEPRLIEESLGFNLSLRDDETIDQADLENLCEIFQLQDFLHALPEGLNTIINDSSSNFSGGEKQKISIIRALLKHPDLLLLDEPTSALDQQGVKRFAVYLKETSKERITIISTHDQQIVELCDAVIQMPMGIITFSERERRSPEE